MSTSADSAGFPWAGRSFSHHDTAYANDDGSAPAEFVAAHAGLRAAGERAAETDALERVVDSVRDARLLIPLVAEAGETGLTPAGKVVDKTQELSIPTVHGPDGAPVLPVFSSTATMSVWRSNARPVPASMQRVAAAALEDDAGRVVLDAGSETEIVLTKPMLVALLSGEPWQPAYRNAEVAGIVEEHCGSLPSIAALALVPRDAHSKLAGPEVELLVIGQRSAKAELEAALQGAVAALATDPRLGTRLASLSVRVQLLDGRGVDAQLPPGSRVLTFG